ncbi:hypothetical protein [Porcipelethomonas sp.]|uniref:hypothetical protein n=1 Tax=Porcipelethomonas sp. TaxID=2981675 RepID=UPI003EF9EC2B
MNFWSIGNINSYVKNVKLQQKWKQKKTSGDFSSNESKTERQRLNEQFKKSYMEQREENTSDETLSMIHNKINSGSKLTNEEMQYLQSRDPMAYQKIKNREAEKASYEKELKRCKTKDDVKRLKMSRINGAISAINSVKDNPNIPDSKKLEVINEVNIKMKDIDNATYKYIKSGEYYRLPTEAEKNKAEHDLREAEQSERDEIQKRENISKIDDSFLDLQCDYEKDYESEKISEIAGEREFTRIEAENTPEAIKLKRSKAKAAYQKTDEYFSREISVVFKDKG